MILDLLKLDRQGEEHFSCDVEFDYGQSIYGGQLLAQALRAAYFTVGDDFTCHSLHLYFIRPGWPQYRTEFRVRHLRDGRSFMHREVDIEQQGKLIARVMLSFQRAQPGPEHQQLPIQPLPDPLQYPLERDLVLDAGLELTDEVKRWFDLPIETRVVSPIDFADPKPVEPSNPMWFRYTLDVSELTPAIAQCLLAYLTDYSLLDASLRAQGVNWWRDKHMLSTSLDHALWFHQPTNLGDWLYFDHVAPIAKAGRCFNRGEVFSPDGRLVASIVQEGLLRVVDS